MPTRTYHRKLPKRQSSSSTFYIYIYCYIHVYIYILCLSFALEINTYVDMAMSQNPGTLG